jgi:hypothetical protein
MLGAGKLLGGYDRQLVLPEEIGQITGRCGVGQRRRDAAFQLGEPLRQRAVDGDIGAVSGGRFSITSSSKPR